jgi:hypothetical protein
MRKSLIVLISVVLLAALALPAAANPGEANPMLTVIDSLYCEDGTESVVNVGPFSFPGYAPVFFGADNGVFAVNKSAYLYNSFETARDQNVAGLLAIPWPKRPGQGLDTTWCWWKAPPEWCGGCEMWFGNDVMFLK